MFIIITIIIVVMASWPRFAGRSSATHNTFQFQFPPLIKGEDCLSGLSDICMFFKCSNNKNKLACSPLANGTKCLVPINLLIGPECKTFHLHLEPNLR